MLLEFEVEGIRVVPLDSEAQRASTPALRVPRKEATDAHRFPLEADAWPAHVRMPEVFSPWLVTEVTNNDPLDDVCDQNLELFLALANGTQVRRGSTSPRASLADFVRDLVEDSAWSTARPLELGLRSVLLVPPPAWRRTPTVNGLFEKAAGLSMGLTEALAAGALPSEAMAVAERALQIAVWRAWITGFVAGLAFDGLLAGRDPFASPAWDLHQRAEHFLGQTSELLEWLPKRVASSSPATLERWRAHFHTIGFDLERL